MKWSIFEIAELRKRFPTTPTAELAKDLKRSQQAVSVMASKLGLKKEHYGIVWTDQQLKLLKTYFPVMFNRPLAKMIGVSQRTMIRKARELGIDKEEGFIEKRRDKINAMAGAKNANNGTIQKGEHRNPEGEFKKGHKLSPESEAKRAASLKASWAKRKLYARYGVDQKEIKRITSV